MKLLVLNALYLVLLVTVANPVLGVASQIKQDATIIEDLGNPAYSASTAVEKSTVTTECTKPTALLSTEGILSSLSSVLVVPFYVGTTVSSRQSTTPTRSTSSTTGVLSTTECTEPTTTSSARGALNLGSPKMGSQVYTSITLSPSSVATSASSAEGHLITLITSTVMSVSILGNGGLSTSTIESTGFSTSISIRVSSSAFTPPLQTIIVESSSSAVSSSASLRTSSVLVISTSLSNSQALVSSNTAISTASPSIVASVPLNYSSEFSVPSSSFGSSNPSSPLDGGTSMVVSPSPVSNSSISSLGFSSIAGTTSTTCSLPSVSDSSTTTTSLSSSASPLNHSPIATAGSTSSNSTSSISSAASSTSVSPSGSQTSVSSSLSSSSIATNSAASTETYFTTARLIPIAFSSIVTTSVPVSDASSSTALAGSSSTAALATYITLPFLSTSSSNAIISTLQSLSQMQEIVPSALFVSTKLPTALGSLTKAHTLTQPGGPINWASISTTTQKVSLVLSYTGPAVANPTIYAVGEPPAASECACAALITVTVTQTLIAQTETVIPMPPATTLITSITTVTSNGEAEAASTIPYCLSWSSLSGFVGFQENCNPFSNSSNPGIAEATSTSCTTEMFTEISSHTNSLFTASTYNQAASIPTSLIAQGMTSIGPIVSPASSSVAIGMTTASGSLSVGKPVAPSSTSQVFASGAKERRQSHNFKMAFLVGMLAVFVPV